MKVKLFLHFLLVLGIYLGLSLIELYCLSPLLDIVTNSHYIRLIVYLVLLILVNPYVTYILKNKVKIDYQGE